jgi:hypothetical protein
MLTENVDIQAYDWNNLPSCGFFEVLGKRGTGKTTWTQYIQQFSGSKDTGVFIVMGGSETVKEAWSSIVHPIFIVDPNITYLETLKDTQNEVVRKHQKSGNKVFPPEHHITLILDDVSSNKKLMRSQIISYFASNSRHLHMSIYILAQYHCQIVAEVRNQFDIVFALSTSDSKSVKRLHSEYCSCVDVRIFKHILTYVTRDFGMLVIDNQTTSGIVSDVCMYGRMSTYPPELQSLGSPCTRIHGENHYCESDQQRPSLMDADDWDKLQNDQSTKNMIVNDRQGKLILRMM